MINLRGPFLAFLILSFAIFDFSQAQDQQGFISLDCGLPANESPYTEPVTKLTYTSDADFIKTGKSGKINAPEKEDIKPYTVLRYFPDGVRNCYTLSVVQGANYLIIAFFTYGNYDNLNIQPKFDLYLGPNIWTTVDLQRNVNGTRAEIIHIPRSTSLQICLVKTGTTTPVISALELRPLRNDTYIPHSGSLKNRFRVYLTDSKNIIRYPEDVHDRLWSPFFMPDWKLLRRSLPVNTSDNEYDIPEDVVATAAIPGNVSSPLTISWNVETPNDLVYGYLHFAELQSLDNDTREFNISAPSVSFGPITSEDLEIYTLSNRSPIKCEGMTCHLRLVRTPNSTLPPLLNAIEVYTVVEFPQSETNANDVVAIKSIETSYGLSRISWQGDPCVPQQFLWDGLTCENTNMSTPPRIHSLDLSSSELTGIIVSEIQNLTQLQKLDLSNNNLTGGVPEFLAKMKSLLVINLSGNNLSGSVPQALLDKVKKGLVLNIQGNPNLCSSGSCNKKKYSIMLPVVASLASLAAIIAAVALIFVCIKRRPSRGKVIGPSPSQQSIETKKRRFTYAEVLAMTNNNEKVLGKGGFGMVYHGYINGTEEVAVKLLSPSSTQGYKEFKTEVELLLRVHHTNLVGLVGYCDEKDHLALIYQYMANGDLKKHLSGGSFMSWVDRLNIAVDAAQGLEYLHTGCKPLIVHRDVKSSNILLDDQFQGKLADFGLSRSFPIGDESHVSTVVAGTLGYLDPEYYQTSRLSEKSDVYSFGVVLLQMITNKPVIDENRDNPHIAEWVKYMLSRGDINNVMDPKLQGVYDSGSAWKALELAVTCVSPSSLARPNMSHVVHELKECLISEKKRTEGTDTTRSIDINLSFGTHLNPKAR